MIRFALSPDGEIVPDVEGRLPGRGVWLSCSREILKKAIQSKAFSRSLKQQAAVPAGLEDKVEALLTRRVGEYLSFANKAGQVDAGFQQVDAALEKGVTAALPPMTANRNWIANSRRYSGSAGRRPRS